MYKNKKALTLVELIVVITILVILATIAYIYFDGNLAGARDAKRNSDLNQIVSTLELFETEKGFFPEPSNPVNITYSGSAIAWTQGTFGTSVSQVMKVFGAEHPVDPLHKNDYTYSITNMGREFQIAGIHETHSEEEGLGEVVLGILSPQAQAAGLETALVLGDYNGVLVKATDLGIEYFIASPSIITTDTSNPDILDIIINRKLVYNNFFNLPESYKDYFELDGGFNFNVTDPIIYQGNSDQLKSEETLLAFNSQLKYIYATTPTESFDKYVAILEKEGLTSLKGFMTRKFKITFKTYFNCKDILDDGADDGSKMYMIDPDGPDGEDAYEVYCDMDTDGGGWTRVGDNHLVNGDFSGGEGITDAITNTPLHHSVVALTPAVDTNDYALKQTGNYSSYYKVGFADTSVLKPGYEIRMSLWRSDMSTPGTTNTMLMGGKNTPWTIGTCTSGTSNTPSCYFTNFNRKLANTANFGPGGNLSQVDISVKAPVSTVSTNYLDGGVLFDGFIPSSSYSNNYGGVNGYTSTEKQTIDDWVQAGGFLISTNNESSWDPLGEYFGMPTIQHGGGGVVWRVQDVNHPLVNGSIGLKKDIRNQILNGTYARASLGGTILADDIILARDYYAPKNPTVLLRKHGKGYILFISDDGMFVQMSGGNIFDPNDNETVFAAAIMTYAIETAAGINPHDGYVFHNRLYYNDGTFSTNGEDTVIETLVVNDGTQDKTWTHELTRHKIYKVPESFDWYIGLDANNNKELYFTGVRLELYYR